MATLNAVQRIILNTILTEDPPAQQPLSYLQSESSICGQEEVRGQWQPPHTDSLRVSAAVKTMDDVSCLCLWHASVTACVCV